VLFPARRAGNLHRTAHRLRLTLIGTLLAGVRIPSAAFGYMLMSAIGLHNVDVIMA